MLIRKIFILNSVCVLTKIQNLSDGIIILSPGSAPWVGLWGTEGAQRVKFFFKHGHVAYQIDGDD